MILNVLWVSLALAGTLLFGGLLINAAIDLWIARTDPDEDVVDLAVGDVRAYAALFLGQLLYLLAGAIVVGAAFFPSPGARDAVVVCLLVGQAATMLAGVVFYKARVPAVRR